MKKNLMLFLPSFSPLSKHRFLQICFHWRESKGWGFLFGWLVWVFFFLYSTVVGFGYASLGKCWGKIKEWSFIHWYPHRIFLCPPHFTCHYTGQPERVLGFSGWTGGFWMERHITVPWHWMLYMTASTEGGERSWSFPWQPLKRRHQKGGM